MASDQMKRENVSDERKIEVGKDKLVPKMKIHFESLFAGNVKQQQQDSPLRHQFEKVPSSERKSREKEMEKKEINIGNKEEGSERKQGPNSLEEISNSRTTPQQNSMEAIRTAEERYEKAKQMGAAALQKAKEYTTGQSKDTSFKRIQTGTQTTTKNGKERHSASQYAAEIARAAKDTAVNTTVATKDVTLESGKKAAGYAVKVAAEVKDKAVVGGWSAAHYTLEKVADATKAVAGGTSTVAGYTGEKAVAAKDKVVGAGEVVKDAVVATEEKAEEYVARKKVEAQKDLEAKKSSHDKGVQFEEIEESFDEGQEQGSGNSIFQAIGETIVEIGQTTKELLIGK